MALVDYVINKMYSLRGHDYDDLKQAGNVGLVKAACKFEKARHVKFSSYAVARIRGEILDYIIKSIWGSRCIAEKQKKTARIKNCDFGESRYIKPMNDKTESIERKIEIMEIVDNLSGREKEVILLYFYYGFFGYEIAKKLGVSGCLVSLIKARALRKLKNIAA